MGEGGGGKRHGRDWRGGVAVAVGNGGGSRNPGKPLKNDLLAIFSYGEVAAVFSGPSTLRQAQGPQEAAAICLQQKMARCALGALILRRLECRNKKFKNLFHACTRGIKIV